MQFPGSPDVRGPQRMRLRSQRSGPRGPSREIFGQAKGSERWYNAPVERNGDLAETFAGGWIRMPLRPPKEVSQLLIEWSHGNKAALDQLIPLVDAELRRLAHQYMSQERPGHTLQTTALVNEAYLRLADQKEVHWQNRAQFLRGRGPVDAAHSGRSCPQSATHQARRRRAQSHFGRIGDGVSGAGGGANRTRRCITEPGSYRPAAESGGRTALLWRLEYRGNCRSIKDFAQYRDT